MLKNNISIKAKFRVLKSYVWSIFWYDCESWTLVLAKDAEKLKTGEI